MCGENKDKNCKEEDYYKYLLYSYKKREELYFNAVVNQSNLYDKYIFFLAAGSLSVSLTLIKDIFSNPVGLCFLLIAWLCFGVSMLVSLYSFILSQKATLYHFIEMQNYIKEIFGRKKEEEEEKKEKEYASYPKKTELANQVSFWFLTCGFICMFLFLSMNLYRTQGGDMKKKSSKKEILILKESINQKPLDNISRKPASNYERPSEDLERIDEGLNVLPPQKPAPPKPKEEEKEKE